MARLKHHGTAPPGSWQYRQKETGLTIKSDNFDSLVAKVVEHRAYRGLQPQDRETVALEVDRQLCSRLNHDHCYAEPGDGWVPVKDSAHIRLSDILAFSKTMLMWLASGRRIAPMEEAQRRRAICKDCPLNRHPSGCKCGVLYKMIASSVPKDRQFEDVHVCSVCQCSLKSKVNVPMEVIRVGELGRNLQYPVTCWLHPEHKALQ